TQSYTGGSAGPRTSGELPTMDSDTGRSRESAAVTDPTDPWQTRPHSGADTIKRKPTTPADWPTIPGYQILVELGRGGMGVVYKAEQLALKRVVALKIMLASTLASPKRLVRFRIEAEAVARLQHPNIVQIYEIGEHERVPFFTLEYVDGG